MHFSIMQCSLNQTPAVFLFVFFVSPWIPQASATFDPSFFVLVFQRSHVRGPPSCSNVTDQTGVGQ